MHSSNQQAPGVKCDPAENRTRHVGSVICALPLGQVAEKLKNYITFPPITPHCFTTLTSAIHCGYSRFPHSSNVIEVVCTTSRKTNQVKDNAICTGGLGFDSWASQLDTVTLSLCPNKAGQQPTNFLHHNQIFDVIIEKKGHDIKYLIMTQKVHGLLAHSNWTYGQGKCRQGCEGFFGAVLSRR